MRNFFTRNIILYTGILLISNFELLASAFDNAELVEIICNKLNPDQHFLAGEEVIFGTEKEKVAYERAILKTQTCRDFPFFADQIFFQYLPKILAEKMPDQLESMLVNPEKAYVYNKSFRVTLYRTDKVQDEKDYYDSRLPLSEYIAKLKASETMKEALKPGEIILYHPLTASPFIVYSNTICADTLHIPGYGFPARWKLRHFNFQNEIPVAKLNTLTPTFSREAFNSTICRQFYTTALRYSRYIR